VIDSPPADDPFFLKEDRLRLHGVQSWRPACVTLRLRPQRVPAAHSGRCAQLIDPSGREGRARVEIAFLHFSGGILLLYLGGNLLVTGSSGLAALLGVRPLVAGLTIVAFATSTPELAVTLDAAIEGYSDIAIGNVVGSNVCNIALILGLSAVIAPVRVDPQLLRVDIPIMLASSALLVALLLDDRLTRAEGVLLILGILAYVSLHLRLLLARRSEPDLVGQTASAVPHTRAARHVLFVVAGIVALGLGGYSVVHGGVELAKAFGVSNAVIALTVVAIGTSLPELSTTLVAAVRSHADIALGNVIGTNIFNILAILGVTATIRPLFRGGVDWLDLVIMFSVSVLIVPLSWNGLRLGRGGGVLLLICYAGYSWWRLAT
jgi:cation:H+ antiporter